MLKFEDYTEQRLHDELFNFLRQNGYNNINATHPEFRAMNEAYKQAYLSYHYGDNIAEKLRSNNTTLHDGMFTKNTVQELLTNEWNSRAGLEAAKMVKSNPIAGMNPNTQMLNIIGDHLNNNRLITNSGNARNLEEFDSVFKPNNTLNNANPSAINGGIEKNMMYNLPVKNNLQGTLEEYPQGYKPADKLFQLGVEKNVYKDDLIREDEALQQKIQQIRNKSTRRRMEIEKEHRLKMAKYYGGAALQFASALMPAIGPFAKAATGIAKLLSPLEKKILVPWFGKKIAEATIRGSAEGFCNVPINLGVKAILGEQITKEDVGRNIITSSLLGAASKGAYKWADKGKFAENLRDINKTNKLTPMQRKELKDKATQYYKDFLEHTSVELGNGKKVKFGSPNNLGINAKNANAIPDLPNQLKKGKIIDQGNRNKTIIQNKDYKYNYSYDYNHNIINNSNGNSVLGRINLFKHNKIEDQILEKERKFRKIKFFQ